METLNKGNKRWRDVKWMNEERWSIEEAQEWRDVEKKRGVGEQRDQNNPEWIDEEIERLMK